jgi:putative MATE family efflux protein
MLIARPMLILLDTPAEILGEHLLDGASGYLFIFMAGFLGCSFYNMGSGILRGLGDSIMPLVYLVICCVINIVLDITFVGVLDMGVPGVSLATVIAQMVSGVLCMIRLSKMRSVLDVKLGLIVKPDVALCGHVVKVGAPSGLTQAVFSCAGLVVQALANSFGTTFIAANIVIMRVDGFAMMPNFSLGMAMTTYVGQNIGAGNTKRVNEAAKHGLRISLTICTVLVVALVIFGEYLARMFSSTPEVVDLSMRMRRVLAVGYLAVAVTQVLTGIMRGAGDTVTPMFVSIFTTVVLRVPLAYLMAFMTRSEAYPVGRPEVMFISMLISWVVGAVITAVVYMRGGWKKKYKAIGDRKVKA